MANVSDHGFTDNPLLDQLTAYAKQQNAPVVAICAAIESEIADLDDADKTEFLADMGMQEPGLDRLIRAAYALLGLQTYFTAGVKEVRAWTIHKGDTAPQAAGVIHTDFERGFIRAQTIAYEDFIAYKGEHGAKEAGKMRAEGKEYVVKDGDVLNFLFNVYNCATAIEKPVRMPVLTELNLYPIKSCAGIAVAESDGDAVRLDERTGLRSPMDAGRSCRQFPDATRNPPDGVHRAAPGKRHARGAGARHADAARRRCARPNRIARRACGDRCGTTRWPLSTAAREAAAWFSQALGTACRLARFDPRATRSINNRWTGGREVQTHFADGYPMLLISEASLADLNQKLAARARPALPMNRFRPIS